MVQDACFNSKSEVVECVLLNRPSSKNRSPYVADVKSDESTHLAHVPSLSLSESAQYYLSHEIYQR